MLFIDRVMQCAKIVSTGHLKKKSIKQSLMPNSSVLVTKWPSGHRVAKVSIEKDWLLKLLFHSSPDSTVLAYVMKTLNERHNYELDLYLLSVDEGITGYRDDSLEVCESFWNLKIYLAGSCMNYQNKQKFLFSANKAAFQTVKRNRDQYCLPLKIVSYEELYGWTMDAIVKEIGLKNNCEPMLFASDSIFVSV